MKAYGTLMRLSLLNLLAGFRGQSWRKENGKLDVGRIAATVVIVAGVATLAGMVLWLEITLFQALATLRQPALLPGLTLFAATVMTLILSLFGTLTALYMSRDTAWLATLPVPPTAVMAMKWTSVYAGEALINIGLIAPAAVLYGLHLHAGPLYYVRALTIVLATPMLPLALTTLLSSLLARGTALTRHRELWVMLGSLVMVAVVWGVEFSIMPELPDDADALYIARLLLQKDGAVHLLLNAFPPVRWAMAGLDGDWLRWALYLFVSVGAVALVLLVAGRDYLNVCLRQSEQATHRRAVRVKDKDWRERGPLAALFRREWTELVKNPNYAMNAFSGAIIFPMMLLVFSISSSSSEEAVDLSAILPGVLGSLSGWDKTLIFAACMAFPLFVNVTASTAVSREGPRLYMSRMLPVPASTMMNAKLLTGLAASGVSVACALIVIAVTVRREAVWLLTALPLTLMAAYATSAAALTLDAMFPRLTWTNEAQAMKQNFNSAISMLISLLLMALAIATPFFLLSAAPYVRFAAAAGVLLAECAVTGLLLHRVAARRYEALEG